MPRLGAAVLELGATALLAVALRTTEALRWLEQGTKPQATAANGLAADAAKRVSPGTG